ncbi:MAG: GMP synthase-like glutamine amidotransferase [Patescibacteria group bacterium]|jgi:GMP synthase-like glutamine amidotransferase
MNKGAFEYEEHKKVLAKRVLIVDLCADSLHRLEFVRPIEMVVSDLGLSYDIINFAHFGDDDLEKYSHVIICGTALSDNMYLEEVDVFESLFGYSGKVLGICAGMQILGLLHKGILSEKIEIGYSFEEFSEEFLGVNGRQEVYHLHQNYIDFSSLDEFRVVAKSDNGVDQAVVHSDKDWFGVLFHPEVRQSGIIETFVGL